MNHNYCRCCTFKEQVSPKQLRVDGNCLTCFLISFATYLASTFTFYRDVGQCDITLDIGIT